MKKIYDLPSCLSIGKAELFERAISTKSYHCSFLKIVLSSVLHQPGFVFREYLDNKRSQ